ncbi:DUF4384 domain-containing protein [Rhodobacteraceae bacterium CH30]|nr:DUF4384 domain-containing protein [Rhodobacteraceae bacterium CH30]
MSHKITALAILLATGGVVAEEQYSAKALFFTEDEAVKVVSTRGNDSTRIQVAKSENKVEKNMVKVVNKKSGAVNLGASYFIRLKNNSGGYRDVLANQKFKTGDKFQLGVKVNKPAYVYILNEDAAGVVTRIYPQPGRDNHIDAMGTVFLPSHGSFEFEGKPGVEQLRVYLSPTPIQDLDSPQILQARPDVVSDVAVSYLASSGSCGGHSLTSGKSVKMASAEGDYASKAIKFSEDTGACLSPVAGGQADLYASKGIAFSSDPEPAPGGQVASYVVKKTTQTDKNLYLKINLVHD